MNSRGTSWPHVSTDAIKGKIPSRVESEVSWRVERSWQPSSLSYLQRDCALLSPKWELACRKKSGGSIFLFWKYSLTLLLSHYNCFAVHMKEQALILALVYPSQPQAVAPETHCLEFSVLLHSPVSWVGPYYSGSQGLNICLAWNSGAEDKRHQCDNTGVPIGMQTFKARREWWVLRWNTSHCFGI